MFAVRIDDTMRSALDKAAEDEGNTAAGLARLAIRVWLQQRGYLKWSVSTSKWMGGKDGWTPFKRSFSSPVLHCLVLVGFTVAIAFAPAVPNEIAPEHDHEEMDHARSSGDEQTVKFRVKGKQKWDCGSPVLAF
jgi:hypothetical protein